MAASSGRKGRRRRRSRAQVLAISDVKFYAAHLADPQIDDETKEAIQQRSGIRFHFEVLSYPADACF